jgi:hypothetical protein
MVHYLVYKVLPMDSALPMVSVVITRSYHWSMSSRWFIIVFTRSYHWSMSSRWFIIVFTRSYHWSMSSRWFIIVFTRSSYHRSRSSTSTAPPVCLLRLSTSSVCTCFSNLCVHFRLMEQYHVRITRLPFACSMSYSFDPPRLSFLSIVIFGRACKLWNSSLYM